MKKAVLCLVLSFFVCVSSALANHGSEEFPSLHEKYFMKVHFLLKHEKQLALTEEQVQALTERKFEMKRQLIQAESQKKLFMLDIYKKLHTDAPNVDEINALIDSKTEVKKTLAKSLVQALVDAKSLLTPEQREKAKELYKAYKYGCEKKECPMEKGRGGKRGK
ncbi:MAG: hypothetical protein HY714_01455 [Candidatus Omnitrophica bacterium]|nr:hypothetical protein [Candidatus Omnitrophota bacterium]